MFLGKTSKVYILDKVEGNAEQINGHSLYASVWYAFHIPSYDTACTRSDVRLQGLGDQAGDGDGRADKPVLRERDAFA